MQTTVEEKTGKNDEPAIKGNEEIRKNNMKRDTEARWDEEKQTHM